MSRCFPYPPPYFGEAEIESIKKEKERLEEEANKARKREKKDKRKEKEKKHKRSDQGSELSKELKESLKKRKYEELGLVEPEDKHGNHQNHKSKKPKQEQLEKSGLSDAMPKKPRDEQLERSGLSEEHGQPSAGGTANFESPERSPDSSKRRGSTLSRSPSFTTSGSTIRIKLQSKSRDSASEPRTSKIVKTIPASQAPKSAPQATKSRDLFSVPQGTKLREQVSVTEASKPRTSQASQLQKPRPVLLPQTLKPREPVLQTSKSKEPALESLVPKPRELLLPNAPKAVLKPRELPPLPNAPKALPKPNVTGLPKRDGALKSQAGLTTSSVVARASVLKEPLTKAKLDPCNRTQIWEEKREAFQKPLPGTIPEPRDFVMQLVQPVNPKLREVRAEPVPASKSTPVFEEKAQAVNAKHFLKQDRRPPVVPGVPSASTDEPCFSGRKTETGGEKTESKHHHHHSSSRRSKRKEAKKLYEELLTNWTPPVIDQFQEDAPDLDWLMSGAKRSRVENDKGDDKGLCNSSSKCKGGEVLLGHTNGMCETSYYQTRATHIPELEMYQLPYVVPF